MDKAGYVSSVAGKFSCTHGWVTAKASGAPAVGQHHQGLQVYTWEAWGTAGAGERLAFGPLPPLQQPGLLATKYLQAAVNERAHTGTALTGPEFPNCFLIPKKLWKRPKLLLPEAHTAQADHISKLSRQMRECSRRLCSGRSTLIFTELFKK